MSPKEIDYLDETLILGEVEVKFTKADGSERTMRCTKNFDLIPLDQQPASSAGAPEYNDLMKVFDIDSCGWRAFKPSRVISWAPV